MRCYAFGSNGSGQLGIGHREDVSSPEECLFSRQEDGCPVRLAASGNATLILFDNGVIYYAGRDSSDNGHLASGHSPQGSHFRRLELTNKHKAKLCSATWEASIVVTLLDEVFVCGTGPKGELGLGRNCLRTLARVKLDNFLPERASIVDVASSVSHTVVVLSNGEVYGWGNGRKGQLGEPAQIVWVPRKIESLSFNVVRAICGREFTLLVGEQSVGQFVVLGSDKWNVRSQAPMNIAGWVDLNASWGSIFVLIAGGRICSWGRNDHRQLAPKSLPQIGELSVGSEHAVALSGNGNCIYCWGWGEHGNCGKDLDEAGNTSSQWNKIDLRDLNQANFVVGVGAGCATSYFWTGSPSPSSS